MIENINFNIVNAAPAQPNVLPKTTDQRAVEKSERIVETPEKLAIDPEKARNPEEARFEVVRRAAESYANVYAVSDVRFTIYKDVAGNAGELIYITRFTSLRDGKVTVIPEQGLVSGISDSGTILNGIV